MQGEDVVDEVEVEVSVVVEDERVEVEEVLELVDVVVVEVVGVVNVLVEVLELEEVVMVVVVEVEDDVVVVCAFCEFKNSTTLLFPFSETQRLPEESKARSSGVINVVEDAGNEYALTKSLCPKTTEAPPVNGGANSRTRSL